jgi:hypothetical protein
MISTVLGVLAVCMAMLVSVVGLALVQRLVSSELRKQHIPQMSDFCCILLLVGGCQMPRE